MPNFVLGCQISCRFDGGLHSFDGEEGGEVGSVGRDNDKGEKPPKTGNCSP